MSLYPDDSKEENNKYVELHCYECGKYCGLYFRDKPTFFKELFFCTFKCQQDHLDKKEKSGKPTKGSLLLNGN